MELAETASVPTTLLPLHQVEERVAHEASGAHDQKRRRFEENQEHHEAGQQGKCQTRRQINWQTHAQFSWSFI